MVVTVKSPLLATSFLCSLNCRAVPFCPIPGSGGRRRAPFRTAMERRARTFDSDSPDGVFRTPPGSSRMRNEMVPTSRAAVSAHSKASVKSPRFDARAVRMPAKSGGGTLLQSVSGNCREPRSVLAAGIAVADDGANGGAFFEAHRIRAVRGPAMRARPRGSAGPGSPGSHEPAMRTHGGFGGRYGTEAGDRWLRAGTSFREQPRRTVGQDRPARAGRRARNALPGGLGPEKQGAGPRGVRAIHGCMAGARSRFRLPQDVSLRPRHERR